MTPSQKRMLDAVSALTVDGVCPTYRELGAYLGIASTNNVHRMLHMLMDDGHLVRKAGRWRSLHVVGRFDPAALANMSRADLLALRDAIDARLNHRAAA